MSDALLATPIGRLRIACSSRAVTAIERIAQGQEVRAKAGTLAAQVEAQLLAYFAGERTSFDWPLEPKGTPFQKKVWQALRQIPHGQTAAYADVARQVACASPRAVGAACGANPLLIVTPCHRVIAKGGGLGGFSAGLENKEWLLKLEKRGMTL